MKKSGKTIIALFLAAAVALTVGIVAKKVASSPKSKLKKPLQRQCRHITLPIWMA